MREDADNGNDASEDARELLGFFAEDSLIVERLDKSVQALIKRNGTTPEQVFHLAKLLHALRRLPLPTNGISIELSLSNRHANGEMSSQGIVLDDQSFRLSNCDWIIVHPAVGGDAQSETIFEVEGGGFREVAEPAPMIVMDWLDAFDRRIGDADQELQVHDSADSSGIDWDAETGEAYWDRLESDYT